MNLHKQSASSLPRPSRVFVVDICGVVSIAIPRRRKARLAPAVHSALLAIRAARSRCDGQYPRYVYGVWNPARKLLKIGIATLPTMRLAQLDRAQGRPGLLLRWTVRGDLQLERELHGIFGSQARGGEWFEIEKDLGALDKFLTGNFAHERAREEAALSR